MGKSDQKDNSSRTTRRDFAKHVALVAAIPLISPAATAQAQEAKSSNDKPADAVSEALTEIVRARYGRYLTPDQLKEIKKSMEEKQRAAETMKKRTLQNGDEPAFIFFADLP
jgi:hypothetical protein